MRRAVRDNQCKRLRTRRVIKDVLLRVLGLGKRVVPIPELFHGRVSRVVVRVVVIVVALCGFPVFPAPAALWRDIGRAAVAIENAELYEDIRRNYYETLRALTTAIEARDPTTYNHSERVTQLADRLAVHIGMGADEREILKFGCILHDIGKIGIEESAMEARDPHDREQVFYRMHPLIGRSILQPIGFLADALPTVVSHHENWDGTGFPEHLAGESIPFHARICAIVDSYERLRNPQSPLVKPVRILIPS